MKFIERLTRGLHTWDQEHKKSHKMVHTWEELSYNQKLAYECQAERIRDVLRKMKEESSSKRFGLIPFLPPSS